MHSITFPGRTDVRKLFFSVASLLMLPALLLILPLLSPGPLLYGLVAFLVLRRRRHSAALRPYGVPH